MKRDYQQVVKFIRQVLTLKERQYLVNISMYSYYWMLAEEGISAKALRQMFDKHEFNNMIWTNPEKSNITLLS